jgi:predicted acetyltransferase
MTVSLKSRLASLDDCSLLAEWNHQLIQDEGHSNPMTVEQLEERMRGWLASGEYQAVIFETQNNAAAYALFREAADEIYLRQFFVVRHQRHTGIGSQAMQKLFAEFWPHNKRWTVSVLVKNLPAVAFWRAMGYADYALTLEIMPNAKLPQGA